MGLDKIRTLLNLQNTGKLMFPVPPDFDMNYDMGGRISSVILKAYQQKVGTAINAAISTRPHI